MLCISPHKVTDTQKQTIRTPVGSRIALNWYVARLRLRDESPQPDQVWPEAYPSRALAEAAEIIEQHGYRVWGLTSTPSRLVVISGDSPADACGRAKLD